MSERRVRAVTPTRRGRGRPTLGHQGHPGRADRCNACWLRRWREGLCLTQAQAAAKIPGTSLRAYHRWERADVPVPELVLRFLRLVAAAGGLGSTRT